jgi:hypothetical protein
VSVADLLNGSRGTRPRGTIAATYAYTDATGTLVARKVRTPDKRIYWVLEFLHQLIRSAA